MDLGHSAPQQLIFSTLLAACSVFVNACGDDSGSDSEQIDDDDDDDDDDTGTPTVCDPGEIRDCACPGGSDGTQRCSQSDEGWSFCECSTNTDGSTTDPTDPTMPGPCSGADWEGSWNGQVGPGCDLDPAWEAWADALTFLWSTEPEYLCQALWTQTTCLGERFEGYWYDPGDSAILMINSTTSTLNATAPGAAPVVFAHEWGHVNQDWLNEFSGCSPLVPFPHVELEADCYAGFASAFLENGTLYESAFLVFSSGCGIFDPAHGSCDQRWCAFDGGYQAALSNAEDVCMDPLAFAADLCPLIVSSCL